MAGGFVPDLMVLDIALPGMDGLALPDAIWVKDRLREIPILILTNHDDPGRRIPIQSHKA
jgi:CheY-like chemotaxis protein